MHEREGEVDDRAGEFIDVLQRANEDSGRVVCGQRMDAVRRLDVVELISPVAVGRYGPTFKGAVVWQS